MREHVPDDLPAFWKMAAMQCTTGDEEDRLRFLKFLLAGFCMFVQGFPGHPVGMPFPGGDKVEVIEGVGYCPVRSHFSLPTPSRFFLKLHNLFRVTGNMYYFS
jgi:uncharacterized protein (UPF0305 family)